MGLEIPCLIFVALLGTGSDPQRDRLIHLSASSINPSADTKTFGAIVNPGVPWITPQLETALRVEVGTLQRRPTAQAVLESFFRYCKAMAGDRPIVLVSHNGHHYQWPLLTNEIRRSRVVIPGRFELWDSLLAVRPFYERGYLASCRPAEIVRSWNQVPSIQGPLGDIHTIVMILELLSRLNQQPPFAPTPQRIYHLLRDTNEPFIAAQKQNSSNHFETRRMSVNTTTDPEPPHSPETGSPHYDPNFIPDPISEPEPAPVPQGVVVYDEACQWIDQIYPEKNAEVLGFLELLQKRHNFGQKKYKQPLMTDDGRDDVEDAMQELGDLFLYAYKARLNHLNLDDVREYAIILQALLDQEDEYFASDEPETNMEEEENDDDENSDDDIGSPSCESSGGHPSPHG